ncbi:MAG TPA: PEGA domain-containing protein, partial [Polyangia bacterium]|nr:PEGA domain-containing protein [Polyangia bacterium]
ALFNLANCYKALTRYDEALAALFRLQRDFASKLGGEMESETIAIEKEIKNLVGTLKVEVDRPGAEVLVDGREVGASPLSKTLLLAPGNHEVSARLEGVEYGVEKVRMLPGKEQVVRVKAKGGAAAPGPGPATAPAPAADSPHPGPLPPAGDGAGTEPAPRLPSGEGAGDEGGLHSGWFWGMLAATAVLGGVTIGIDAAIGKASDEMKTDDDLNRAEGMQAAGVTFVVLTGAAAITTAVLAFFTDWGGDEEAVEVGLGAGTVSLHGRF